MVSQLFLLTMADRLWRHNTHMPYMAEAASQIFMDNFIFFNECEEGTKSERIWRVEEQFRRN